MDKPEAQEESLTNAPEEEEASVARAEVDPEPEEEELPNGEYEFEGLEPKAVVEALLFSSSSPVKGAKLAKAAGMETKELADHCAQLNKEYEDQGRAFMIVEVAKGFQMVTRPDYFSAVQNLVKTKTHDKLTQAGLETLAIIAYKQPIIRADVESVRGVQSGQIIRNLLERRLIRVLGRDTRLGHPLLYGTTQHFLEVFGLNSLKDLPSVEELNTF